MKYILMISGKAQSGKDTSYLLFEGLLGKYTCKRLSFADKLKEIAKKEFSWQGEKDEVGRNLLIKVGQCLRGEFTYQDGVFYFDNVAYDSKYIIYKNFTYLDVVYKCCSINPFPKSFYFAEILLKNIELFKVNVITDFRFISEYEYLKIYCEKNNITLYTLRVARDSCLKLNDRSEKELDDFKFDYYLDNNGSIDDLSENISKLITDINFEF